MGDVSKVLGCELVREIRYASGTGEPFMALYPKVAREGRKVRKFAILQRNAWMFSEHHNQNFEPFMFQVTMKLQDIFDLGMFSVRKMAMLATLIQEGIDDLIHAKPNGIDPAMMEQVGEVTITARPVSGDGDGQEFTVPVTKEMAMELTGVEVQ